VKHWIELIYKHHKEWIDIATALGSKNPEDIVQEAYYRLLKYGDPKKFIRKDKVHRGYMFFVIRNIYNDEYKKSKKMPKDENTTTFKQLNENELEKEKAFWKLCQKMDKHLESFHWYDKKIFEIYRDSGMSIRKMAKETQISWVNIFHTLKKVKTEMREKFGEDWLDYLNEDYERI
tara:strand:+ start:23405 stop:23932 length:528 start_codon:yes stop_codon:yes gene_type:complete